MTCNQCCGIEQEFDKEQAEKDLLVYRQDGPAKTTAWLIEALLERSAGSSSVLDIGGGVGAIQHRLLEAGVDQAVHVDASAAYLQTAREEAERRGLSQRVSFYHGDFVSLADQIGEADIVTLDRVVCCYHEMRNLVDRSAKKARRYYALVYPRDAWWMRAFEKVINGFFRLRRSQFRVFVHPTRDVERLLSENQLKKEYER